jgi:tripartite-type tricarboxylate transporter receptor subunit TctC
MNIFDLKHNADRVARRLVLAFGVACALAVSVLTHAPNAAAQDYPSKPIRLILPFAAGTGPDVNTREIAAELGKVLGQSIVVENRPGAAGMIGMEAGAKSAPDGYTLIMGSTTTQSIVPHAYAKVTYQVERDFDPVSLVGLLNAALIAHPSVTSNNAAELIKQLKAQPESLNAATQGIGGFQHLSGEWFTFASNTQLRFIPYNASSPFADLLAGQMQLIFDALPASIGNVRAGKLKILAITGKTRHVSFPDVPTFAEAGLGDYSPTAWLGLLGLLAPAGTPPAILEKLSVAMQKATTQNPVLIEKWRSTGGELRAMMPAEFKAFMKSDSAMWSAVIRRANIKLE